MTEDEHPMKHIPLALWTPAALYAAMVQVYHGDAESLAMVASAVLVSGAAALWFSLESEGDL